MTRGGGTEAWLDAHVVAGVVSAVLLAAALVICVCVAVRRQRYGGYRCVGTRAGGCNITNYLEVIVLRDTSYGAQFALYFLTIMSHYHHILPF